MPVQPIPEGYHTVTPFLMVKGADRVIDFVKKAFDAQETHRSNTPDGKIMHAEVTIGDSRVMLSEAVDPWPAMPSMLYLYVKDVDAVYRQAIQAGGVSVREPTNEFYGDRSAGVKDSAGNQWWIGTHIEDVSPEEMKKREKKYLEKNKKG